MKFHALSLIFPEMVGEEFNTLVSDIKKNGLETPILLHSDGSILDGRNRYNACLKAKVKPEFKKWDGKGSAIEKVIRLNMHRRHLTSSQRSVIGEELKKKFEDEAKERQGSRTDISANLREGDFGKASEKAAELLNVSARSIETVTEIKKTAVPEVLDAVKEGKISVSAAKEIAALPEKKQKQIVSKDKKEIKEEIKKTREEIGKYEVFIYKKLKKATKDMKFSLEFIEKKKLNFKGLDPSMLLVDLVEVYKLLGRMVKKGDLK